MWTPINGTRVGTGIKNTQIAHIKLNNSLVYFFYIAFNQNISVQLYIKRSKGGLTPGVMEFLSQTDDNPFATP